MVRSEDAVTDIDPWSASPLHAAQPRAHSTTNPSGLAPLEVIDCRKLTLHADTLCELVLVEDDLKQGVSVS